MRTWKATAVAVWAVVLTLFAGAAPAVGSTVEDNPVLDAAGIFSAEQVEELRTDIYDANDKYDLVFVVETVPALNGTSISDYAVDRANTLGVGDSEKDNGVYMLISESDREVWLTVGGGVQSEVTDRDVQDTIDQVIVPAFKQGDYFTGVVDGMHRIGDVYTGEYAVPAPAPADLSWPMIVFYVSAGIVGTIILLLLFRWMMQVRKEREPQAEEQSRQEKAKQKRNAQVF